VLNTDSHSSASPGHHTAAVLAFVLFVILASIALTVDVPRTEPGIQGDIKGDEATYVAAALSLAFDGDLAFQQQDLERFEGLYHRGPEGIFLKRGKRLQIQTSSAFPFVRVAQIDDGRTDRLYFAKALVYSIAVAPFVRFFGMNGFLLFHVVLLAAAALCGYLFLAAQMNSLAAVLFTSAFLGASALPVYAAFLTPELFNFALVVVAYFFWLHKEVAGRPSGRGIASDVVAATLLGVVTYSKPTNWPLIAPLVLCAWWYRRWMHGFVLGVVFVAVVGLGFGITLASTGELNYMGGDRKTFYGAFPFDGRGDAWARGIGSATDGTAAQRMLTSSELPTRFLTNLKYFLVGRHFGLLPYFFPGVVAAALWLFSRTRRVPWRVLTFLAFVVGSIELLLLMPYTWSGGGGPTGNRYLLSIYPVLLFLIPPITVVWPAVLAWIGGALFTAKILVDPFSAAKYPYLTVERGFARRLPVELTMANDLPVRLAQPLRARIPYGSDPRMLLYFLDQNAFPPEPPGVWIAGGRRADILVRTVDPIEYLNVSAESPIATTLTLSMGRSPVSIALEPGKIAAIRLEASGVRAELDYAYLLTASSSNGFVPNLRDPGSNDYRNLGALVRFAPVTTKGATE
jgi:hypothetical protein